MTQIHLELADLFKSVNRKIFRLVKSILDDHDLPFASRSIVFSIRDNEGATVSEVARQTGLAKSHVSNTVRELVARGMVEKRLDPSDKRLVRLYVTDEAHRLFEELHHAVRARLSEALAPIPTERLGVVLEVLMRLDAAIGEDGTITKPFSTHRRSGHGDAHDSEP